MAFSQEVFSFEALRKVHKNRIAPEAEVYGRRTRDIYFPTDKHGQAGYSLYLEEQRMKDLVPHETYVGFGQVVACVIGAWLVQEGHEDKNFPIPKEEIETIKQTYLTLLTYPPMPETAQSAQQNALYIEDSISALEARLRIGHIFSLLLTQTVLLETAENKEGYFGYSDNYVNGVKLGIQRWQELSTDA